ncbi:MAG TPA: uracil-DNA glycosylase [Armatimonadota bacterium]|nr:uracil-DNA glycosylase [Armatimonadota bacterium]
MLDEIAAQIRACTKCRLCQTRANAVPGEGPADAAIMFVGEGPGANEDAQARPFVGRAGQLLNTLLLKADLRRPEVFITNIVKCRPPDNRDPQPDEIEACNEYLVGQIATINPAVVCTLGRPAMTTLIGPGLSISKEHGVPREIDGITYVPLYHPAAALYQQSLRPVLVEDMRRLAQSQE